MKNLFLFDELCIILFSPDSPPNAINHENITNNGFVSQYHDVASTATVR